MQTLYISSTAVTHSGTQTTEHLVCHFIEASFVGHTGSDAFRHKLLDIRLIGLEIAVFRTFLHSLERTHATICLVFSTIIYNGIAGRFLHASKHTTEHNAVGTCGKSFHYIA